MASAEELELQLELLEFALESEDEMFPVDPKIVKEYILTVTNESNMAHITEYDVQVFTCDFLDFEDSDDGVNEDAVVSIHQVSYPSVLHSFLSCRDKASRRSLLLFDKLKLQLDKLNYTDGQRGSVEDLHILVPKIVKEFKAYLLELDMSVIYPMKHFRHTVSNWTESQRIENENLTEFADVIEYILDQNYKIVATEFMCVYRDVDIEVKQWNLQQRRQALKRLCIRRVLNTAGLILKFKWAVLLGNHTLGPLSSIWHTSN